GLPYDQGAQEEAPTSPRRGLREDAGQGSGRALAHVPALRVVGRAAAVGGDVPALGTLGPSPLGRFRGQPRRPAGGIRQERTGPVGPLAPGPAAGPGRAAEDGGPRFPLPVPPYGGTLEPVRDVAPGPGDRQAGRREALHAQVAERLRLPG